MAGPEGSARSKNAEYKLVQKTAPATPLYKYSQMCTTPYPHKDGIKPSFVPLQANIPSF
jgi:hypothetical protein